MRPSTRQMLGWFVLLVTVSGSAVLVFVLREHDRLFALFLSLKDTVTQNGVRETIADYGVLAPIFFMALQILQVAAAPLPGEATGVIGGYLFGAGLGFFYSSIGLILGSCFAFVIGHLFGNLVMARLEGTKAYSQFNHYVMKGDYVIPFIMFLIPGFPKDILCYMMGLSVMPFRVFLFISSIARMPGTLMLSFQGAQVYQEQYGRFFVLFAFSLAISLPCYLFRKRILAALGQYNNKSSKK